MLSAHENPAFQAMCREHEIEGTAMVALCGLFWDRSRAALTSAPAEPSRPSGDLAALSAAWTAYKQEAASYNGLLAMHGEIPHGAGADFQEARSALFDAIEIFLTAAPAETPPATCEHEWVSARNEVITSGEICAKLCGATRAETPPAAGAIDARGQEDYASAKSYASSLATALFNSLYAQEPDYASGKVVWGLCDSLSGILTQIDNMVSGLVKPVTPDEVPAAAGAAQAVAWVLKFPNDDGRLCLSAVFDTKEEAEEYAGTCDLAEIVALYALAATPAHAGKEDGREVQ